MKKRFMVMLIVSILCVSLMVGCGSGDTDQETSTQEDNVTEEQGENSGSTGGTDVGNQESADEEIVVAYFAVAENSEVDAVSSASVVTVDGEAKGMVKALADMIQSRTGGELFSVQTSVNYPGDRDELIEFAAEEQREDARPELISHMENFEQAKVVFIGYPLWWYDLPQVMYSFFDEYDFSGKTIIPFCTHNGSRFSGTIETIQELEPEAVVLEDGFTINERDVKDAEADVNAWLEKLGY